MKLSDAGTIGKEELGVTWHRLLDSDRLALLGELTFANGGGCASP